MVGNVNRPPYKHRGVTIERHTHMSRKQFKEFSQFAPQAYYYLWAEYWSIDLQKYPYSKTDFDGSVQRDVPYCVFDFDIVQKENGQKVAMALVTYKSVFSKSKFTVVIYL